jgi:hypothetical protein
MASGHEERFPPTRLSAGCGFIKETIAGMRRNGRDAPEPAVLALTRHPGAADVASASSRTDMKGFGTASAI